MGVFRTGAQNRGLLQQCCNRCLIGFSGNGAGNVNGSKGGGRGGGGN